MTKPNATVLDVYEMMKSGSWRMALVFLLLK